ncbi:BF3164 family lipoprotein [Chondrinema litorale]|uniref:BF3164 family lipoprotein n=1 Tax=Chondrinema litorale TaxID=2994555 RepID=UPI002543B4BD|nr:BF3164 family lipoprotein [Chondrinema litorale]UZR97337.1 BF3164 family lipoprotein [Chondrinema litorale]
MKFIIKILFLLLLLQACTEDKHPENYHIINFDFDSFSEVEKLKGQKLDIPDFIDPRRILNLKDYLVVSDDKADFPILILDKKTNTVINKMGVNGRGPGEIGYIWNIKDSGADTSFWVYQLEEKQLSEFTVNQTTAFTKSVIEFDSKKNKMYSGDNIAFSSDTSYMMKMSYGKDKFVEFNEKGRPFKFYDTWAHMRDNPTPDNVISALYNGTFKNDNSRENFILASIDVDVIELLKKKDNEIISLRGPVHFEPKFSIDYSAGVPLLAIDNKSSKYMYLDAAFGKEFFYALFSGDKSYPCGDIFVFDYEGNPQKHYQVDRKIKQFDVDETDGKIYALTGGDPQPNIIIFDL